MGKTNWIMLTIFLLLCAAASHGQPASSGQSGVQISELKLGREVRDREIVDESADFELNAKVFLWIKVLGAAGRNITVIWKQGDLIHATELAVGGSPWRTWAAKNASVPGDWLVTVTDDGGKVLKEVSFRVK